MDPNYKKDGPGKSLMGMDLIPVYEESSDDNKTTPGTIVISADVINNLGVRTAKAEMGQLHNEIKTVGYIQFDEDQLVHIHPRVEGWIEKLHVKSAGDPVEKGQALYEIYSPSLVNAQEELVLALKRHNKTLINASKQRLRSLQLPEAAIKQVIRTQKVQQNITFYAPQSGVVDKLMIRQGMYVKPGTIILSIGKLDQVWFQAEVFERQASVLKVGAPVSMVTDFIPGKTWQGEVDYIQPILDAKTRTLKVRLKFENKEQLLKPNMFTEVTIHSSDISELLLVPRSSVIRSRDFNRIVLALGDGKFKSIAVKLGQSDNNFIEITSGLSAGDKVVVSAQFLLDSESSKSSDFIRMNHQMKAENSVTTTGVINSLMINHGMLNISRGPIEEWNRSAATMDFVTDGNVDITNLDIGSDIEFSFYVDDGNFVITNIKLLTKAN
jgi:Cu(I)/Ag(I) efflux system membrane fusion protein